MFYGRDFAGGASHSMADLVSGLVAEGHEVHALLSATPKRIMAKHLAKNGVVCHNSTVPWIVYDATQRSFPTVLKNLVKWVWWLLTCVISEAHALWVIKRHGIQVVHIGGAVITTGCFAARIARVPVVWHIREYVEEGHGLAYFPGSGFYRKASRASLLICVSDGLREKFAVRCAKTPAITIYNGISVPEVRPAPVMATGPFRLMFAGGINASKGLFLLLDAIRLAQLGSSLTLDVFGRSNLEQRGALARYLRDNGLESCVSYHGMTSTLAQEYVSHDALVVASVREAFGRVTAEAMILGCLVVGSDSGGTGELLADGRGLLFESGDVESLADSLRRCVARDPQNERIRERARVFASQNFTTSAYVNAVDAAYKGLDRE
ncbi:MAG: glycosyltransferase [Arachnia sp.]